MVPEVPLNFTVLVAKGLEEVAVAELQGLGLEPDTPAAGSIIFQGPLAQGYRAAMHLRSARRVLLALGEYEADGAVSLYEGAKAVRWEEHFGPKTTFAVEASVRDSFTGHSGFAALKVKDAVADRCRTARGSRPDVDRHDPDMRIFLHLSGRRASLGLDLSGPLHKRGYRVKPSGAALNETLAAGILLLLGYDGSVPFADPFCGSGTFAIEAALLASRTAPGLLGGRAFALERWPSFDARAWKRVLEEAMGLVRNPTQEIVCSDQDPSAVRAAHANLRAAGMLGCVRCVQADARAFAPERTGGLLVSNPPYGDHSGAGEDLGALYTAFGDTLKKNCAGWKVALLVGQPALAKRVGLRPARRIPLYNGPDEVRLLVYELYEGSKKAKPTADGRPPTAE